MLPFEETPIGGDVYLRKFNKDTNPWEYVWHRDLQSRIIEPTHETDWMFQVDDSLPIEIKSPIFVEVGVWHRLIKGTNDLILKITKKDP